MIKEVIKLSPGYYGTHAVKIQWGTLSTFVKTFAEFVGDSLD